jgi:hypothetical protein
MIQKQSSGATAKTKMRNVGPGKNPRPVGKPKPLPRKGRKNSSSYTTVETTRLAKKPKAAVKGGPGGKVPGRSVGTGKSNPGSAVKHKGSHPSSGGKRLPGYKPAGPSNMSGPGGKKETAPIKKMPKRKPAPMPGKGTPKPRPTEIGPNGVLLLGTKRKSK